MLIWGSLAVFRQRILSILNLNGVRHKKQILATVYDGVGGHVIECVCVCVSHKSGSHSH